MAVERNCKEWESPNCGRIAVESQPNGSWHNYERRTSSERNA